MVKRPTIEDVAKMAGVSRATVDRVINGRGGVRSATVAKVEGVLRSMKYTPSSIANVANARQRHVEVIIAEGGNPFFAEIQKAMKRACGAEEAAIFTFRKFDPYRPGTLAEQLAAVGEGTDAVIIIGADSLPVSSAIAKLEDRGVRIVTAVSNTTLSEDGCFVGQDNFLAGQTAAKLMLTALGGKTGSIAVLIGHLQFRHLMDRRAGFEQSVELSHRNLKIVHVPPYGGDAKGFVEIFKATVASTPDLVGVYLCGGGLPEVFRAVKLLAPNVRFLAHEVTEATREGLADGTIDAIVAMNMEEVAAKAVEAAIAERTTPFRQCQINIHLLENLPRRR